MARIRTIKPEFWIDDRITECSLSARLLFIATWNFADDEGNLERSAKQLKAQAFPHDRFDCESLIKELLRARLLTEYEISGKKYLHINHFAQHQKINRKGLARWPVYAESLKVQVGDTDDSLNAHGPPDAEVGSRSTEVGSRSTESEGDARGSNGASRATRSTGHRLPLDWILTPEREAYAKSEGLSPEKTFRDFFDYWTAAAGAKARKVDWDATWRMWCRRSAENVKPGTKRTKFKSADELQAEEDARVQQRS